MYYKAQANVICGDLKIFKGQSIKKEVFDKLPERQKIKFVLHTEESDVHPAGFNEIIGDNDVEKAKREALAKEDADKKKAAEETKKKK